MTQILIDLDLIDPNPWQPRTTDDPEHISNLAISIAQDGLLQPPAARRAGERYQLVFGHSRFKAFQYLNLMDQTDPHWFTDHGIETSNDWSCMPLEIVEVDDEGMYRQGISENLQRKDLNAVEEAQAMQRAMRDFNYTSAQVGELFGKNEATVRGLIRLLELPAGAKDLLAKGEISQGAARALMSMQKISSAADIEKTAKAIKANNGVASPDAVVIQAINDQPNTITMWEEDQRHGDQKPRAGWHNSWLLDMKNFPNKLLPALTIDDVVSTLEIADNRRLMNTVINHFSDPSLLAGILETSEYETDQPLAGKLSILIDPPSCSSCPFYTRLAGKHFCGLRKCHERKSVAWKRELIRAAGKDLGIAIYNESDGPWILLTSHIAAHDKIFKERHADLRLIEKEALTRGYAVQYGFKGINDNVFIAVVVGKTYEELKETKKQERAQEKAGLRPVNNRDSMLADKKERMLWDLAGEFGLQLFVDFNLAALSALSSGAQYWSEKGPAWAAPKEKDAPFVKFDYLRRQISLCILSKAAGYYNTYKFNVAELAAKYIEAAATCGITLPDSILDMARQADAEIDEQYPIEPVPIATEVNENANTTTN